MRLPDRWPFGQVNKNLSVVHNRKISTWFTQRRWNAVKEAGWVQHVSPPRYPWTSLLSIHFDSTPLIRPSPYFLTFVKMCEVCAPKNLLYSEDQSVLASFGCSFTCFGVGIFSPLHCPWILVWHAQTFYWTPDHAGGAGASGGDPYRS